MAGKRRGTEDDRHLWPEMLRAIREIKPRWVVGENVFGFVNWSGGMVFREVISDLENEGYEVQPFIIPACAVNAPHRRDRVWIVAKNTRGERCGDGEYEKQGNIGNIWQSMSGGKERDIVSKNEPTPDTKCKRHAWKEHGQAKPGQHTEAHQGRWWADFPTQPPLRSRDDELSNGLDRYITPEIYGTISQRYTDKELQKVWEAFQSEEIREQIGRLYKIHEPGILLKVLQLCSPTNTDSKGTSVFSEDASEKTMRKLRKYGTLANTPQGRELEKQFKEQFNDSLPYLSHEIALVAMEAARITNSAYSKLRNESIKAYGNAIVPQVALQIFKAIEQYENL